MCNEKRPEENKYDADFYDADYYERGQESGKGWYQNYRWMPVRSFREAMAVIDTLKITERDRFLDYGCAKGFLVRALREMGFNADGCDISAYALGFAPAGCWNCSDDWTYHYAHAFCKDVFEHMTEQQLIETLKKIISIGVKKMLVIVPLGDNGIFRIPEYHTEISHQLIHDESWWESKFTEAGFSVNSFLYKIKGLKDNWSHVEHGNGFYVITVD